jgi:hypothetical protein
MAKYCQGYNPSPTNSALDWPRLEASDAAGDGSTRARVQGTLLRRSGRAENGQCDGGNEKIENCDTANAVDAGSPKGKDEAIGDWTEFKGFADVGLSRFSAAWACSRELIPGAARLRGGH